jgi:hypothetical protein
MTRTLAGMNALLSRRRAVFVLGIVALVVVALVAWPTIYEIFRVPNYYVCDPFWPFSCRPGF